MHEATGDSQTQTVFKELQGEFNGRSNNLQTVTVRPGAGTAILEHVHIVGLPVLGQTHASIGNGLVHVAPVLGLCLPPADALDSQSCELVSGGMEAEAYRCCQLIEGVLMACSVNWSELVRLTVHVADLTTNKLEAIERVVDGFFAERRCLPITKTAVGCSCLRRGASLQMEGVGLAPNLPLQLGPPPGLERLGEESREGPRGWIVVEPQEPPREPQAQPVQAPTGEPESSAFAALGMVGDASALRVVEVPEAGVQQLNLRPHKLHNTFCRIDMLMNKTCRTVRLDPAAVVCQREWDKWSLAAQRPWASTWSFTFDVALVQSTNCFVNVGLVEWVASVGSRGAAGGCGETTLAQLLGVCEGSGACAWQHESESPRQMMLGCRKGVKWYGNNSWESMFKDDICEGTTLRFQCEYVLGARGEAVQIRLSLLPSFIIFRKRGRQWVQLGRPLAEWVLPPALETEAPQTCSLWIPGVTLFSQDDAVMLGWRRAVACAA